MPTAEELIDFLRLQPHPREGGWYRETHRSALQLPAAALAPHYRAARSAGTAIYYLLTPETCSALHRLPTDEVFHFYLGDAVEMLQLGPNPQDGGRTLTLGSDILAGQQVQTVVPAGVWQWLFKLNRDGLEVLPRGSFPVPTERPPPITRPGLPIG